MNEEFEFYMDELFKAAGFSNESRRRKLQRYREGRALYAGTKQDFDRPGYDLWPDIISEGDDRCIYEAKLLHNLSKEQPHISTMLGTALRLQAAEEELLEEASRSARNATPKCGGKDAAGSVTTAVGQPAYSTMEACGDEDDE